MTKLQNIIVEWKDKTQMHLSVNHAFLNDITCTNKSQCFQDLGVIHTDNNILRDK